MEVVINDCFGGFGLSPEAVLWLWDQGVKELGQSWKEHFGGDEDRYLKALAEWRDYQKGDSESSLFITAFSSDEETAISYYNVDSRTFRCHPKLVECVKLLGKKANGSCSELKIVEIPDDIEYEIEEYDGHEHIAEKHRTWS